MDNLVYLSYGQGAHLDELAYSIHSALYMLGSNRDSYRITVYTDDPRPLRHFPVNIESLTEKTLADWAGPFDFNHRRKIFAIKHALEELGGRLIYCDADTFFMKHPKRAFASVRAGHTLMHIGEYHLYDACARTLAAFIGDHDLYNRAGERWNITRATAMFNAGVIGLHEADIGVLDEVLHLTDQIYPHVRIPTVEQFAFSVCLRHYTKLSQSYRVIHHYWPPERRAFFREQLSRVLHDGSIPSSEERFRQLWAKRPSQTIKDRPFNSPAERSLRKRIYVTLWAAANRTRMLNPLKRIAAHVGFLHNNRSVE